MLITRRHVDRISLSAVKRLEDTPQGYLWCRDVPLARTGTMEYSPLEVPIPALPGSRSVIVDRTEDEVFSPEAIESFRGMPLTDDHPDDDVTVENWRQHNVGDIHNPRRGTGEHTDCLVGDILVKDSHVIGLIKSRKKRELSGGYDAEYVDVRPGYGRQVRIRGNHVSLVDAGRAGPRIAIRDTKPMSSEHPIKTKAKLRPVRHRESTRSVNPAVADTRERMRVASESFKANLALEKEAAAWGAAHAAARQERRSPAATQAANEARWGRGAHDRRAKERDAAHLAEQAAETAARDALAADPNSPAAMNAANDARWGRAGSR